MKYAVCGLLTAMETGNMIVLWKKDLISILAVSIKSRLFLLLLETIPDVFNPFCGSNYSFCSVFDCVEGIFNSP